MTARHVARRTCIGCRRVGEQRSLLRLARRADGVVVVDVARAVPGRGAWVCGDPACVEQAIKARRFAPAFRKPCEVRPSLAEEVRGLWRQR
jgi:predicted RNA-binding protein YlxR (DUF448 family)